MKSTVISETKTYRAGIFYALCMSGILVFCLVAGCTNSVSTSPDTGNLTSVPANDVIIPVDSPSSLMYTSNMQKGGVPGSSLIYEGLVIKDRNGTFDPALAQSWSVSPDAKTWTFDLVQNATWSDGAPFTCNDVKFTNDYMKANNLTMGYVLSDVQSVECPGNYTAVFNLKTPYSAFLDQISRTPGITISPAHIWQNISDPQHYKDNQMIGTGPFVFAQAAPGYYQFSTNENYHGRVPTIPGVVLKVITNADSQVLALKNGEIDVVSGLTPAVAQSLSGNANISIYSINDTGACEVAFNMAQYPANISAFRHAMSHAIDRDTISSLFGTGRPTETTFLIPDLAGDYINPADVGMYNYNLTEAQELLAQAGFVRNANGILIGPEGNPVTITIPLGTKGADVNDKIIAVLKNDWAQLGISVSTLNYQDATQYRNAVNANPVFIDSFPVLLHDDPDALGNFAVTPLQETNYYNYNDPEYNRLVARVKNTTDPVEVKEMTYQLQDLLAQDIPTVPVATTDTLVAYRSDRFVGWDIGPGYHSIMDPRVLENLTPVQQT
jgi:peptide/nickel transport system substrate-binding protein